MLFNCYFSCPQRLNTKIILFMSTILWISFFFIITILLFVDLFVLHGKDKEITVKRALIESAGWISIAFLFNVVVYFTLGTDKAVEYLTAYLIEKSLSIDNLFVFIIIFSYYNVPKTMQHRVLFWGIIGTIVMRAVFIYFGIQLIERFDFILYFLGLFLVLAGLKLVFGKESKVDPKKNIAINFIRRFIPVFKNYSGKSFFVRRGLKFYATPLFIVLVVIETTDLIFALDSVPAILGISRDPFIVLTSNIFAILGLRSLYFALAGIMSLFHLLRYGLGLILVFIGAKIFSEEFIHINIFLSLGFVLFVLAGSMILSVLIKPKKAEILETAIDAIK
jgi:tellurite resistance protein TerC